MDSVLIVNGRAQEIWRGKTAPPLHGDLTVVDAEPNTVNPGDIWDGKTFSAPVEAALVAPMTAMKFAEELFDVMRAKGLIGDSDLSAEAQAFLIERRAKENP